MGLQFSAARAIGAISTWSLKSVFRRPAANFPGKVALYVDPCLIAHLVPKLKKGSVMVVGTNGKTTATNLLADALEAAGERVACNRTGANLDSGVATALLHTGEVGWGVFESDELWLAKILPHLKANYVVLLNLFRDQLDRVGEIDRIQDSIVGALESSPDTVLVYNADDPLCAMIAERTHNTSVAFGIADSMGLPQNTVADATICQRCSTILEYAFRQYGQLGAYSCPNCGFTRPKLDYEAKDVRLDAGGLSFVLSKPVLEAAGTLTVHAAYNGAYMVYNLMAVAVAANLLGCPNEVLQRAIDKFDPRNGRLQEFDVGGRRVLLNLAKNPTGFNQNLKIVNQDTGPKAVAFFINDKEADGHDVSWLWDIDFEELSTTSESGLTVFAGGIRCNDMRVRLKYAGIDSDIVADANDLLARLAQLPQSTNAYLIANYTAMPDVKKALDAVSRSEVMAGVGSSVDDISHGVSEYTHYNTPGGVNGVSADQASAAKASLLFTGRGGRAAPHNNLTEAPVVIAHLFPDLLNLYGDGGNVRILEQRLRWRGIPVKIARVKYGQTVDLSGVDLVVMGGGPDREQRLASTELMRMKDDLRSFVEDNGVLLAICGGFQILGKEWLLGEEAVQGLGIVDITTERAPGGSQNRLIDNIALRTPLAEHPVVGYENHAGRTHLGAGVQAFGTVTSSTGHGNNDTDGQDGVLHRNVVGTYLHGPLLAKNPEIADALLARALERRANREGKAPSTLVSLDDNAETAANEFLCNRLNVK